MVSNSGLSALHIVNHGHSVNRFEPAMLEAFLLGSSVHEQIFSRQLMPLLSITLSTFSDEVPHSPTVEAQTSFIGPTVELFAKTFRFSLDCSK